VGRGKRVEGKNIKGTPSRAFGPALPSALVIVACLRFALPPPRVPSPPSFEIKARKRRVPGGQRTPVASGGDWLKLSREIRAGRSKVGDKRLACRSLVGRGLNQSCQVVLRLDVIH
jgi:hypothetical protein